jgi:hypothetical protein
MIKKRIVKRLAMMFIVISVLISSASADFIYCLYIPNVQQETTVCCWAASSVSVCYYHIIWLTQSNFAYYAGSNLNTIANISTVQTGLNAVGFNAMAVSSQISFPMLTGQITQGRPVLAGLNLPTGGHMVAVDGFGIANGSDVIGYMDPWNCAHTGQIAQVFYYYWIASIYNL